MSIAEDLSTYSPTYDEQRLTWRHQLSEVDCRSLASEYIRGIIDECTTDAFKEFEKRYGTYIKGQTANPSKAKTKGKGIRKSRYRSR